MEKFNVETEYSSIINKANELLASMQEINKLLSENNHLRPLGGFLDKTLINAIKESEENFPAEEIQDYCKLSNSLASDLKTFNNNFLENNYFEISRQKAVREAERKDDWKKWRDKLYRWIVGVSVAVLMYSTFVCFSEKVDFIKVPIHDLVTAK